MLEREENGEFSVKPKPEGVEIPEGKTWEELEPWQRYYYKNKEQEKERLSNLRERNREWYREYKANIECSRCDEDHIACLDFHHKDENDKTAGIRQMVEDGYAIDTIKKEMDKCIVLCSNCHRKEHHRRS